MGIFKPKLSTKNLKIVVLACSVVLISCKSVPSSRKNDKAMRDSVMSAIAVVVDSIILKVKTMPDIEPNKSDTSSPSIPRNFKFALLQPE